MIRIYYLGTILFLLLDFLLDINVRVAFFEANTALRALYYAVIFTCMAVVLWRPSWAVIVGGVESLLCLVLLILSMGARVMLPTDSVLEGAQGFVSVQEMINFLIAGGIAYASFHRGMREFHENTRIS